MACLLQGNRGLLCFSVLLTVASARNGTALRGSRDHFLRSTPAPRPCDGPVKDVSQWNSCQWLESPGDDCTQPSGQECRRENPQCPCGYYADVWCPATNTNCGCSWLPNDDGQDQGGCAMCCRDAYGGSGAMLKTSPGMNPGPACSAGQFCPGGEACPDSLQCPDYVSCDPAQTDPPQFCADGSQCPASGYCRNARAVLRTSAVMNPGPVCSAGQFCPGGEACPDSLQCPDYVSCDPAQTDPPQFCADGSQCPASGYCRSAVAVLRISAGMNLTTSLRDTPAPRPCDGPVKDVSQWNSCQWMKSPGDDCMQPSGQKCRRENPQCPCGYFADVWCPAANTNCGCSWLPNDDGQDQGGCAKCCRDAYPLPCC